MKAKALRNLLSQPGILVVPGATDALSARIVEDVGFGAVYVSGAGIANVQFALPDIGLLTLTEMLEPIRRIVEAVNIPVLADADTGYGNAVNVTRTVQVYEDAGVAAIQLEDQVTPKRSGHFNGMEIIPAEEMILKINAAVKVRRKMLIIARTDAIATNGMDEAVRRANLYARAGADILFVEAPTQKEQIAELPRKIQAPLLFNMTEGAKTPIISHDELQGMGYRIVIHPNLAMRVASRAMQGALAVLQKARSSELLIPSMLEWNERQRLVRLPEWEALDNELSRFKPADSRNSIH
ncbi:MAG: carboxyvinyl-carboxyphosphonate phosphorylmutase [Anaerolineaceae bacterium]|nr:MAG: carboxyvinyl-carboxyphosphonate phosphorylmutase [Anaerolineaceae bacterium]